MLHLLSRKNRVAGITGRIMSAVRVLCIVLGIIASLPTVGVCRQISTPETARPDAEIRYNVMKFGAKGDGVTMDTTAIQTAIDSCSRNAGGTVVVPPGRYLTGTLALKNNVTIYLAANAIILGSKKLADFDPPHLIYAANVHNIGIVGSGVIDGQGDFYWRGKKRPYSRPGQMVEIEYCENVSIKGITIRNSPSWVMQLLECDQVRIDGVTIVNDRKGPNTDGIDPSSSSNVFISNCYIEGGDDCICLKSNTEDKPCENITVTNCVLVSDDSAIKLGTSSVGDIRYCTFSNVEIKNSQYGIALYMKDGGNYTDIQFSNITIETTGTATANSSRSSNSYPIFMDIEPRTEKSKLGTIRNIAFSNIRINTAGSHCLVQGMPEKPIENITFDNVVMNVASRNDLSKSHKPRGSRNMPPSSNDFASVPADFTFANIRGLKLRDVQVNDKTPDTSYQRHGIWGVNLENVMVDGFTATRKVPNTELATINFEQCSDVMVRGCQAQSGTATFLRLDGDKTHRVSVIGNDLSEVKRPFELRNDVAKNAFFQTANRIDR